MSFSGCGKILNHNYKINNYFCTVSVPLKNQIELFENGELIGKRKYVSFDYNLLKKGYLIGIPRETVIG